MNDDRLHVPYIFGNKQNSKSETEEKQKGDREVRERTEGTTEDIIKRGPQ